MKVESTVTTLVCDACNQVILNSGHYMGGTDRNYVTIHGLDICNRCSIDILENLEDKILEEDLVNAFTHYAIQARKSGHALCAGM